MEFLVLSNQFRLFKSLLLGLVAIFMLSSLSAQERIQGRVLDEKNNEPIPFAHIITDNPMVGTTTDIDGRFTIQVEKLPARITVSNLGYQKKNVLVSPGQQSDLRILLVKEGVSLDEVVVLPGENPAHKYVLKAIANRKQHNPEERPYYHCNTYNKFYYTLSPEEVKKLNEKNSDNGFDDFIRKHHLFLMENVSERSYKKPGKVHERILANRVSGIKNPNFVALSNEIQPFSFYHDEIELLSKVYQSPLSKRSFKKYFYNIEDTLIHAKGDTTFMISYRPAKGRNFNALEGVLSINTKGFALENVTAEPYHEELNMVKLRQQYTYIEEEGWFPEQLYADILFTETQLLLVARTYISNVSFDEQGKWKHRNVILEIDSEAGEKADELLREYRSDSLTQRDMDTYQFVDSVGEAEGFDDKIARYSSLIEGRLPIGPIDIMLNRVLNFNLFEGYRLGIGLMTNDKLVKGLSVGGYWAYGTGDRAHKYGFMAEQQLGKDRGNKISVSYIDDVMEPGRDDRFLGNDFAQRKSYRDFLASHMDRVQKMSFAGQVRILGKIQTEFFTNRFQKTFQNEYLFGIRDTEGRGVLVNDFEMLEAGVNVRIAFQEKLIQAFDRKVPVEERGMVLYLHYSRGLSLLDHDFEFNRLMAAFKTPINLGPLGRAEFFAQAGYVDAHIPSTELFYGTGTNSRNIPFIVANTFQTMPLYAYLTNRYVAGFLNHELGTIYFPVNWTRPKFFLSHAYMIGDLQQSDNHFNVRLRSPNKPYMESGFVIQDIARIKYAGVAYLGLGGGVFYNYGHHALPDHMDNMVFKLGLTLNL